MLKAFCLFVALSNHFLVLNSASGTFSFAVIFQRKQSTQYRLTRLKITTLYSKQVHSIWSIDSQMLVVKNLSIGFICATAPFPVTTHLRIAINSPENFKRSAHSLSSFDSVSENAYLLHLSRRNVGNDQSPFLSKEHPLHRVQVSWMDWWNLFHAGDAGDRLFDGVIMVQWNRLPPKYCNLYLPRPLLRLCESNLNLASSGISFALWV